MSIVRLGGTVSVARMTPLELSQHLTEIKVVKPDDQRAIIGARKAQLLQRIGTMQSEVGRMNKLLNELRADVLHLTIK